MLPAAAQLFFYLFIERRHLCSFGPDVIAGKSSQFPESPVWRINGPGVLPVDLECDSVFVPNQLVNVHLGSVGVVGVIPDAKNEIKEEEDVEAKAVLLEECSPSVSGS